ncbi:hypothetical protein R3I94_010169 [Phoxinus phoxinus]|uniref:Uncharacterized protein n=1 Tax=Phoxinus phoxinus TaxID=58324 RepID=A0AAN9D7Q5_9TELE
MKFQVLLLAFALVIATNIHCQAQPQLRDSDKSPEGNGYIMSRRQVRTCNCNGFLSKEKKAFCQKKGIATSKKCKQLTGGNRKQMKANNGPSMPI